MTTEQAQPTTDPRFLTLKEAAAILNVNPSTLSRQCAAGTFPHVRIGRTVRIPVAEVERLERGEPQRTGVIDVPDYVTGTPSMFDDVDAAWERATDPFATPRAVPEADSTEDVDETGREGAL